MGRIPIPCHLYLEIMFENTGKAAKTAETLQDVPNTGRKKGQRMNRLLDESREGRQEKTELPYMGNMTILNSHEDKEGFQKCENRETPFAEAGSEKEKRTGSNTENAPDISEEQRKAEHEAAEARRRAEWEAAQQAKKAAEEAQTARVSAMGKDEVMREAIKRIGSDMEKLTRRNMKECVSEQIQTLCLENPDFARLAMHPRKTMIHCFQYINRHARAYLEEEMKNNDVRPENGVYGGDVPDDLCYQWAEEYFRDPAAKEDQPAEEVFKEKPFISGKKSDGSRKKTAEKKSSLKKKEEAKPEKKEAFDGGQLSFLDQLTTEGGMNPAD